MKKRRYCLSLDLRNDPDLIRQYEEHHRNVWLEIIRSIKGSGISNMEIYRLDTRLFMIMETDEEFSFEKKAESDQQNEKVRQWEELMWKYQQPHKGALPGEKWRLMHKIFDLDEY